MGRGRTWTLEDIELLKKIYPIESKDFIIAKLGRTWNAITGKAKKFKIRRCRLQVYDSDVKFEIDEGDAKWIACAIDTDGCVGLARRTRKSGVYLTSYIEFANDCKEIVEKFGKLTGSQCFVSRRRKNKIGWRVRIKAFMRVKKILERIQEHLIVKQKEATFVLDYITKRLEQGQVFRLTDTQMEGVMPQASGLRLKGLGLKPKPLGDVATPLSPMVDDLYKDEGKPSRIEGEVSKEGEIEL